MSNQPSSPVDHLSDVLARFNAALNAREYGEALVWVNTAALLDKDSERFDPAAPVNTALFQLVFDTVLASENSVLKCGNIITTHGDLLTYGAEATDLLIARFGEQAPEPVLDAVLVIQGHFNNLGENFQHHFGSQSMYVSTTGEEATLLRDTAATIRGLISSIASTAQLKVKTDLDLAQRARILSICVESPDFLVAGFPLRFLTLWDKALFFVESAQKVLAEMKTSTAFARVAGEKQAAISELESALADSRALTVSKSNLAKASYRKMEARGRSLAAACIR
jgi:hypothetical protein